MSDIELKRCPFCGSHARIFISDGAFPRFIVRCGNSVCPKQSTVEANSLEGAIALWNTRPIEDALQAENERFRKALETICAIYEINGAEWRFDRNLYEVAKKALEGKDD